MFVMGRRRGTAGQINPKQNGQAEIMQKSGNGGINFAKLRHKSPLLPSTIGGQNIQ